MQEVFSKIIEELEEKRRRYFLTIANTGDEKLDCAYEYVGDALDKAIEIVKQEAKQYNNGWVPVSERMPNQDGEFTDVLITCESIKDGVFVQSAEFYTGSYGQPIFDALYHYERVLAWKPLPAPYQPKGEHVKKTNFDMCCESMETMAQIIDIAKIGWTKDQIMEWLQKEACPVPD